MQPLDDRVRWIALLALVAVVVLLVTARALAADAPSWGWPLAGGADTVLPYGGRYESGGRARSHTGVDLDAAQGDGALAPVHGTVSFVGEVPSGEDRRQQAVTIQTVDGDKVTLMPLEGVRVEVGDKVAPGDLVARVAVAGDGSSPVTHLHVSVRRGTVYLDPLTVMALGAPAPVTVDEPAPAPEPATDPAPQAARSAAPAATAPQVRAPAAESAVPGESAAEGPTAAHTAAASVAARAAAASAGSAATASTAAKVARAATARATRQVAHAARAAAQADLAPRQVFSLADLARLAHSRDRLAVAVVSYLLATIAATGLIARVVRSAAGSSPEPAVVPIAGE